MFLCDQGCAAAWDHEIELVPFSRTVRGELNLPCRQTDGALSTLEDCCPHGLLPLSMGYLKDDPVLCKYHGLEFGAGGACKYMPGQPGVHWEAKIRAYPVAERDRFVWVWIGNPELADESKTPELTWHSDPDWVSEGSSCHAKCNFHL